MLDRDPADQISAPSRDRLATIPDLTDAPVDPERLGQSGPTGAIAPSPPADPRHIVVPVDPPWIEPAPPAPRRRRRIRLRLRWMLLALVVLAALGAGLVAYGAVLWQDVDRIDTDGSLSAPSSGFVNYLIVGTDDRSNISAGDPAARHVGMGFTGSRSDSMILLRVGKGGNKLISLPRDLWVDIAGGQTAKLNSALGSGGPARLIETIQTELEIPVHRYLQVDLAGFMSLVDTIGGITVEFPRSACDTKSGLDVRQTGPVVLDRTEALAYVRSRTYTEFDAGPTQGMTCAQIRRAGLGTVDPTADIGRTERQRAVLLTALTKAAGSLNPFRLLSVMEGLGDGLAVDDEMSFGDAFSLARQARGLDAETLALPVTGFAAPNGASALALAPGSRDVLDLFRETPPLR
jgi:LCP family protein required for cell wall assembly